LRLAEEKLQLFGASSWHKICKAKRKGSINILGKTKANVEVAVAGVVPVPERRTQGLRAIVPGTASYQALVAITTDCLIPRGAVSGRTVVVVMPAVL